MPEKIRKSPTEKPWQVYVNNSSYCFGEGAGVYVVAKDNTIRLEFKITNNKVEYKAVLA